MKRELWKRLIGTGLCCCMTAGLLAGCGTPKEDGAGASGTGDAAGAGAEASGTEAGGASGESGAASGDVETVTMYQMQFNQNKEEAIARIENEMNKILGERYGVNIDLVMLSISDFATQTNLALASDEVDIVSTYSGFNQVMNMADNNQLISLDDYFANASEEMKSQFTQDELDGMTFHGSLYALNRKYLVGGEMRFAMNEEIANELGIDAGGIKTWEDIDAVLYRVHEAHPDIYTLVPQNNNNMAQCSWFYGDDLSAGNRIVTLPSGSTDEITYMYENPKFVEWCTWMHKWYQDGLIMPDVLSNTTSGLSYVTSGKAFAFFKNGDIYAPSEGTVEAHPVLSDPRVLASGYTNVGYSISTNSKHKDAAWKVLEALYTDPDIANMIAYGIEGTDYVLNDDGTVRYPDGIDSSNAEYCGVSEPFIWPNYTIMYPTEEQGADYVQKVEEYNANATPSAATGFLWDTTEFTDQITACSNVNDKYFYSLICGMVDPEEMLPKALEEIKAAGGEEIYNSIAEQYQAFLDAKK